MSTAVNCEGCHTPIPDGTAVYCDFENCKLAACKMCLDPIDPTYVCLVHRDRRQMIKSLLWHLQAGKDADTAHIGHRTIRSLWNVLCYPPSMLDRCENCHQIEVNCIRVPSLVPPAGERYGEIPVCSKCARRCSECNTFFHPNDFTAFHENKCKALKKRRH
jgi:hypothetical protein